MNQQPLLPHIGVCALVPDVWDKIWQPRHYVLMQLARYFHITWVNPAPEWRYMFRNSSVQNANHTAADLPAGFSVYEPTWLPTLYRPEWLGRYTFNTRLNRVRRLLMSRGCRKIILYVWRPEFGCALDAMPFDLSCYHIDDEYSFSEVEVEVAPAEKALIEKVDQVFIHSPGLMEKKGAINRNTTFIPNGVDFAAYANPAPEPRDLAIIPRPRIGYTGYLKKQLDWPLLIELTRRHGEWSFVFVGPKSPHPEIMRALQELSSYRNVYFLDAKPSRILGAYPQHFDACIMPYRVSAYTNNIYPLKLHEYLASGRPVVSAPIRSLLNFSKVIALADGFEEWSNALTATLGPAAACPEAATARQMIAREFDWKKLVHVIAQTLCERIGSEYTNQFHEIASEHSDEYHTLHQPLSD